MQLRSNRPVDVLSRQPRPLFASPAIAPGPSGAPWGEGIVSDPPWWPKPDPNEPPPTVPKPEGEPVPPTVPRPRPMPKYPTM